MRSVFFLLLFMLCFPLINAQDSGVSFELHYPIAFPNNTNQYSELQGVVGGALQYQFTNRERFNYGIEYKFDVLRIKTNSSFTQSYMINHIDLFSKLMLNTLQNLQLCLNAGFSVYKYSTNQTTPNYSGFNVGLGANYTLLERFYLHTDFCLVKTFRKQLESDFVNKETYQFLRLGIGFRL